MTSSLLQSIESKEQLHNVLSAINEAFPNRAPIENELSKYSASKEQSIRRLQQEWYNRTLPLYTELQVRQMNSAYYSERAKKQVAADLEGRTLIDMDSRSWVVKSSTQWSGWNAAESTYYDSPLLFEGDINFEKNFEPLIVSDKDSKSVNLIVSLSKMIKRGADMCLSNANWSILFLSFANMHMPNDHQNLSKYSDEIDGLFEQIVASVNADSEIAKLRTSMSHISRKPGDSVQTPLYRLKSVMKCFAHFYPIL